MALKKVTVELELTEDTIVIRRDRLIKIGAGGEMLHWATRSRGAYIYIAVCSEGPFAERAFYLDKDRDWVLGEDIYNNTVLIPLRKEGE